MVWNRRSPPSVKYSDISKKVPYIHEANDDRAIILNFLMDQFDSILHDDDLSKLLYILSADDIRKDLFKKQFIGTISKNISNLITTNFNNGYIQNSPVELSKC